MRLEIKPRGGVAAGLVGIEKKKQSSFSFASIAASTPSPPSTDFPIAPVQVFLLHFPPLYPLHGSNYSKIDQLDETKCKSAYQRGSNGGRGKTDGKRNVGESRRGRSGPFSLSHPLSFLFLSSSPKIKHRGKSKWLLRQRRHTTQSLRSQQQQLQQQQQHRTTSASSAAATSRGRCP